MIKRAFWATGLLALALQAPALAGEGADILKANLYGGTLGAGITALTPLAETGDSEARFGLGTLKFFTAIEHMAQALYRYGAAAPDTGLLGPQMDLPVLANPNPEPVTYEALRTLLSSIVTDMDSARDDLVLAGGGADFTVTLDPLLFRIDVNGDGVSDEQESVAFILQQQFGFDPNMPPQPTIDVVPLGEDSDKNGPVAPPVPSEPVDTTIGFDKSDAIWLAGYSQVFALQADFVLAHDFSGIVNAAFHRIFPKSGLPMQDASEGGWLFMDADSDAAIADLVAAIHTLNWPVIDTERLKGVLARMKSITALSRENWKSILAETDDNREFLPSPTQTSIIPDGAITQEMVDAWHETLDIFDQVLDGELLVPHWRFKQGIDLKAYFETATHTDLVMLLTGFDALPYLKEGPIASAESFARANNAFGDRFLGFAFYFN